MGTYDAPGSAGPVTTTDDQYHDIFRFNMASVGSQSGVAHGSIRVMCRNQATNDLAVWSQDIAISIDGRGDGTMVVGIVAPVTVNRSLALLGADIKIATDQLVLVIQAKGVLGQVLVWGAFVNIDGLLDDT